ncbi:MAG: TonB-dependent receptor, partial [Verrucomicrobiota bacterium]
WTLAAGLEYELEDNREAPGDRDNSSIYLDNTVELSEALHWTLGGRYDDNSEYGTNETWRTTISYQIKPLKSRIHASYGTSFDAPTFFELSDPSFGNPNLSPEEGKGWDAGIEVTLIEETLILDATAFGNDIDDKISFITLTSFPDPFTGTYINDESYQSQGLETSLLWLASETLQIKANYTYTDAEYGDGTEAERVPTHLANLSATLSLLENALRLKGTVNYVGTQKDMRFSTNEQPDYATINLSGQYAFSEQFTIWCRLNNILDKDYEEIAGFNTPGFNATAGVRISF